MNFTISNPCRQSKICQFHLASLGEQNVLGLNVPVNDAHFVAVLDDRHEIHDDDGGPVLGLFPDACFNEGTTKLQSGDVLIAYTDGVTEAENAAQDEFGEERLRSAVATVAAQGAKEILDHLAREVTTWSRGVRQHDDITIVVLKKN